MSEIALALDDQQETEETPAETEQETPPEPEQESEPLPEKEAEESKQGTESEPESTETEQESEPEKPDTAPIAALQAERTKAQAERQRADDLEARLQQIEQRTQQPGEVKPEPPIDPYVLMEDPAKFTAHLEEVAQKASTQTEQRMLAKFNDASEIRAIEKHGEDVFKDAADSFKAAAAQNPALIEQLKQQADPGEWLVKQGRLHKQLQDAGGDPVVMEANLRNKIKAELLAEMKTETESKKSKLESLPDAVSDAPSVSAESKKSNDDEEITLALD